MHVPIERNQQIVATPQPAAPESDDEPPDPSPCMAGAPALARTKPAGRVVPFPAHRAGIISPAVKSFRRQHFPNIPSKLWNDWQWQTSHRIRTLSQLETMISLSPEEHGAFSQSQRSLPLGITPYYMGLISPDDPHQPLRRSVIPTVHETVHTAGEADDPLGEETQSPIAGLVHRYPDRVLLLVTDFCSTYCRYCTRSRVVGHGAIHPSRNRLEQAFAYIAQTPAIRDVLISGGDPLMIGEEKLSWILSRLRQIPHVEIVRIGTKVPAVLPQRITPRLVRMLRQFTPCG